MSEDSHTPHTYSHIDYFSQCPIDICEMILRNTLTHSIPPCASLEFARLLRTCKRLRDCAYLRIVGGVFTEAALEHTCKQGNAKYYARVISQLLPGHLVAAVKWCQLGICEYIVSTCMANCTCSHDHCLSGKYLRAECAKLEPRAIVQNFGVMDLLINSEPTYLKKVWYYIRMDAHTSFRPEYRHIRAVFDARKKGAYILDGASVNLYALAIGVDNELALTMLREHKDLSEYLPALNTLLTAIFQKGPTICEYPWQDPAARTVVALTDTINTDAINSNHTTTGVIPSRSTVAILTDNNSVVALLHSVITREYNKDWLRKLMERNRPAKSYHIYMSIAYGLELSIPHGPIDEPAMRYYLQNVAPGCTVNMPIPPRVLRDIMIALLANPHLPKYLFEYIPVELFTPAQLHDVLGHVREHENFEQIFAYPHVNPPWHLTDADIEIEIMIYVSALNTQAPPALTRSADSDCESADSDPSRTRTRGYVSLCTVDISVLQSDISDAIASAKIAVASHRQLMLRILHALRKETRSQLLNLLDEWKISREEERWTPIVAIDAAVRARLVSERVAAEIDREQESIRRDAGMVKESALDDGFSDEVSADDSTEHDENASDISGDDTGGNISSDDESLRHEI